MPAAARERQAVALGQSLRQAAGVIQLPEASALRAALPAAAWAAIAPPLGQLGLGAKTDAPRRPVTTLTLADLRRFLECPLQGSVRVLLPMRDDDDAEDEAEAALRDRESLGDARVQTLPLLRDLFARAIDAGASDDAALAERYDAAIAGLRLDGTLPSGVFGRRRCAPITSRCCARGAKGSARRWTGRLPTGLAPIWYGAAPEHRRDVEIDARHPAVGAAARRAARVALHGQTEPLALVGGERMAVTLVTGAAARLPRTRPAARLADAPGARRLGHGRRPPAQRRSCSPPIGMASRRRSVGAGSRRSAADDARALLAELAADLLADVHAVPAALRGRVHLEAAPAARVRR